MPARAFRGPRSRRKWISSSPSRDLPGIRAGMSSSRAAAAEAARAEAEQRSRAGREGREREAAAAALAASARERSALHLEAEDRAARVHEKAAREAEEQRLRAAEAAFGAAVIAGSGQHPQPAPLAQQAERLARQSAVAAEIQIQLQIQKQRAERVREARLQAIDREAAALRTAVAGRREAAPPASADARAGAAVGPVAAAAVPRSAGLHGVPCAACTFANAPGASEVSGAGCELRGVRACVRVWVCDMIGARARSARCAGPRWSPRVARHSTVPSPRLRYPAMMILMATTRTTSVCVVCCVFVRACVCVFVCLCVCVLRRAVRRAHAAIIFQACSACTLLNDVDE